MRVLIALILCLYFCLYDVNGQRSRRSRLRWKTQIAGNVIAEESARLRNTTRRLERIEIRSDIPHVQQNPTILQSPPKYVSSRTYYDFKGNNMAISFEVPFAAENITVCVISSMALDFTNVWDKLTQRNNSAVNINGMVAKELFQIRHQNLLSEVDLENPDYSNVRRFCRRAMNDNAVFRGNPVPLSWNTPRNVGGYTCTVSGMVDAHNVYTVAYRIDIDKATHDHLDPSISAVP